MSIIWHMASHGALMLGQGHAETSILICRMRPDFWPADAPSGLLNWTDEEEKRRLTMYALSGNRLTWMAATVWPSDKLDQLGSRRYIAQSDDVTTAADPGGRRNRFAPSPHTHRCCPAPLNVQNMWLAVLRAGNRVRSAPASDLIKSEFEHKLQQALKGLRICSAGILYIAELYVTCIERCSHIYAIVRLHFIVTCRCLQALSDAEGGWPQYLLDVIASTPIEHITEHGLFYRQVLPPTELVCL